MYIYILRKSQFRDFDPFQRERVTLKEFGPTLMFCTISYSRSDDHHMHYFGTHYCSAMAAENVQKNRKSNGSIFFKTKYWRNIDV